MIEVGHTPGELAIDCRFCGHGKAGIECMAADSSIRQRAHQVRRDDARRLEDFARRSAPSTLDPTQKYPSCGGRVERKPTLDEIDG